MRRIPRAFKEKLKQIPAGPYCYGEFFGAHPKTVHGKLKFKGGCCPFWHRIKEATEDEDGLICCSFLGVTTGDILLDDQIKICGNYDMLFDYKTGQINLSGSNAKCVLIDDLPKDQQEPFRLWLNGNTAYVPTVGRFATKEHYDYWLSNVWKEIMRLQRIRESKAAI